MDLPDPGGPASAMMVRRGWLEEVREAWWICAQRAARVEEFGSIDGGREAVSVGMETLRR